MGGLYSLSLLPEAAPSLGNALFLIGHPITEVYWPSLSWKCLLCLSSQKMLETQDLSVPLPQ